LNQRRSPPLWLQASHCSTFRIMCDVPGRAVFYSETIDCFLGRLPNVSLNVLLLRISSGSNYYRYINTFHVPNSMYI
jgi:hypothetical protein